MKFDELTNVSRADMQRGLARVPDAVIAASLPGAPRDVAAHILSHLSARRRESLASHAGPFPERTRVLARQRIVREVAGPVRDLMEKLAERHPVFVKARRDRKDRLTLEVLRRMVRES